MPPPSRAKLISPADYRRYRRLLAHLLPGDSVAVERSLFLSGINMLRYAGFSASPVELLDSEECGLKAGAGAKPEGRAGGDLNAARTHNRL